MILLDTCALLALQEKKSPFTLPTQRLLEAPASNVYISSISAFEIGQKERSGQLKLPCPLKDWFLAMLIHHHLQELTISIEICAEATSLPLIHRDPFDRLIIATAMVHQLTIVTSDRIIPQYPQIKTLW